MASLEMLYQHLAQLDDVMVDRSLAAALPTAGAADRPRIVQLLLERQHHEGCVGLILHYHLLEENLQQQIDEHALGLSRSIRLAAEMSQTEGPRNTIQIVRQSLAGRLAYLVTAQLRRGQADLATAAAECLKYMAHRSATDRQNSVRSATGASYLSSAVEEAVVHYPVHEQEAVLIALCWIKPPPTSEARSALGDLEHPAVAPMRTLLAQCDQPAVRRALLWSLGIPTLAEPALAGLRRCCGARTLGEAIESSHLLRLPEVAKPLARVKSPQPFWPDEQQIAHMTASQRRMLPSWLDALPFGEADRVARLMELSRLGDTATRLASLRRLLAIARRTPREEYDDAIARFATDQDMHLARLAVWHLVHCHYRKLPEILAKLVNSPHPQIRQIASQRLAPLGFARLWENWGEMTGSQRLAAGRALIKIDPSFHQLLGERLTQPDREWRVRALHMIGELHQGSFFTLPLSQLAGDEDEYVASAAVAALGSSEGDQAITALQGALEHDDSRVRANAVESLAQLTSSSHVEQLTRIAVEDENRPRANAIAALMELSTADALRALNRMLVDTRSNHRQSALWLVETLGLFDVARHVAEMSISDPDEQTRQRANHVVHELIQMMHPAPGSPAPESPGIAIPGLRPGTQTLAAG